MQRTTKRSLDQLVGEQIARWQQRGMEQKKAGSNRHIPCITVSRDPGSGGALVARQLAKDLEMDLIGVQIIKQVAERADVSEKVIQSLDNKGVRLLDSWMDSLFQTRHISPDEYLYHLSKVVGTIGKQGNAIIMGRGGQFLLPPEENFRVRITALRETQIRNIMQSKKFDQTTAESYVSKTAADRDAFHRKYFTADWKDAVHYDLIINTSYLGIKGAVAGIEAAFAVWKDVPHKSK
ncbi:MAG: cytidylate kinase-like family protein [Syntrophales bacterium]|nr:cytidylate kinase-like family protein [Syntrophales bacterium]